MHSYSNNWINQILFILELRDPYYFPAGELFTALSTLLGLLYWWTGRLWAFHWALSQISEENISQMTVCTKDLQVHRQPGSCKSSAGIQPLVCTILHSTNKRLQSLKKLEMLTVELNHYFMISKLPQFTVSISKSNSGDLSDGFRMCSTLKQPDRKNSKAA